MSHVVSSVLLFLLFRQKVWPLPNCLLPSCLISMDQKMHCWRTEGVNSPPGPPSSLHNCLSKCAPERQGWTYRIFNRGVFLSAFSPWPDVVPSGSHDMCSKVRGHLKSLKVENNLCIPPGGFSAQPTSCWDQWLFCNALEKTLGKVTISCHYRGVGSAKMLGAKVR